jgi:predicted ATPase/DNA-binding CsgD family transcriptional regulator
VSNRSSLPARRTRLIGRETELLAIRDRVLHGDSRLVTLSGAAGAGKTTLAIEVARLLEDTMPDGAALVDLTVIQEPDAIALTCCESLGLIEQGRAPATVLAEHLEPRQLLIVLDNCEHLLPELGSMVDRLLDRCPDLRFLATSRAPLRVRGESLFVVPPLSVPDSATDVKLLALRHVPAVELFVERATAVDPGFVLGEWAPAVVSICRRLDGLPLAIELAAAQAAALTPTEIDVRLATDAGIVGTENLGPARPRTMDAMFDWSYDLLDETEQALFRRLAVFAGGWTLEAAEQVCSLGADPMTITPALVSLVEHSLVVRDGQGTGSRFRMLAPVAEYAARRLAASDEITPTQLSHAQYYLTLISSGTPDWRAVEPDHLDLIAREYENCLAAMRFAERAGLVAIVLGFNISLLLFWRVRGLLRSAERRLEAALALVGDQPSRERGFILAGLAHYGQLLGELEPAAARAAEAEAIFEAVGDPIGRRTVMGFLGDIAADLGDLDGARAQYERARALVDAEAGDLDLGFWHANVGRAAARSGDLATAERELEQAQVYFRSVPKWYLAHVLVQLGSLARRRGDVDRAQALLGEALQHLRRYRAAIEAVSCLYELGRLALDRRDPERAATLFAAATGQRDRTAVAMAGQDRKAFARDVDRARSALAPGTFTDAWSRGLGFTLEQASEFAVSPASAPTATHSAPRGSVLTPREREVATLVMEGISNARIAERLAIAPGTARIHVERILGKLGLTSRVQIATWVMREPSGVEPPGRDRRH